MSARRPPELARWLLQHLGPGYRNESLEGDLFEQYQLGASRSWYWQQAMAAVMVAGARRVRELLARIVATTLLRALTEAGLLLGALVLAQQDRQICSPRDMVNPSSVLTLVAAIALLMSWGFYVSLAVGRGSRRDRLGRRAQTPLKRMLAVFAITALSAGTLTWARTQAGAHCGVLACACAGGGASVVGPQPAAQAGTR